MRKIWVRIVAATSGALVVLLAALFAWLQNPSATTAPVAAPPDPEVAAAGRAVYAEQNCALCHAIAGEGNPRFPLDGVGSRHDAQALRDWILAQGEIEDNLSARAAAMKRAYRELPESDLEALVGYLQTLRQASPASARLPGDAYP